MEIGLLRLAAQRLATPGLDTPAEVVRWLTAVQAQDHPGALTAVALRTAGGARAAVEAAMNAGEIVKSWPMRGTLHLVPAEDLGWMLPLMTPRVIAGTATRRAQLGLDGAILDQARQVAVRMLEGGNQVRRDELFAAWDAAGLSTPGGRGYHMLAHLAQTGTLCFGPACGGEQLIVLIDEWIPRPRQLSREEALGELALRYFRGHGPATVKDFMRWTNLVAADARLGLAQAKPELARVEAGGAEHFMDPRTPELLDACRKRAAGVFLLPGFDEFILGYGDRDAVLPAEHANVITPGGGMFRPAVVSAGRVVGTWKHTGRGAKRALDATPFTSFTTTVQKGITQAYRRLP